MVKARDKPISRDILDTTFEGGMFVRMGMWVLNALPRAAGKQLDLRQM